MNIPVASLNPVKITSTDSAFKKVFPRRKRNIIPTSVPSGVSFQPKSDEETWQGASNRIQNLKVLFPKVDFCVSHEGGIEYKFGKMFTFAWIIIESRTGQRGQSRTSSLQLPKAISDLIEAGLELGEADDQFFGKENSKQNTGSPGLLTGDILTRQILYEQSIILSLIPFINDKIQW